MRRQNRIRRRERFAHRENMLEASDTSSNVLSHPALLEVFFLRTESNGLPGVLVGRLEVAVFVPK